MSVTVRRSSSFHILTSCAQVDTDLREDIISLLLLGNDIASAEALVADKKLGRLRMQAITQTADDGMYVITRGCSQMSRVSQKINNIAEIFSLWIPDAKRPEREG